MNNQLQSRPNILIFMTDQQRFDSLGCYGCDKVDTPVLDRLAQEGALFERCYVNSTICTPSRASMLTGRPVPGHGVHRLHDCLPKQLVMFPERLRDAGYKTALIGKQHVSGHKEERDHRHPHDGYDVYEWCPDPAIQLDSRYNAYSQWLQERDPAFHRKLVAEGKALKHFPEHLHMSYWAAERTMDFMERHQEGHRKGANQNDQPFFCFMSLYDPHDPYHDYPPESAATVHPEHIHVPKNNMLRADDVPVAVRREQEKYVGQFSDEEILDIQRGYYASIGFLDEQIGKVLTRLEQLGLSDNTLIFFLSDHGDMMGDKDLLKKGAYFYEPCAHVPFLMKLPGVIPAGVRRSPLIQPHDIAATCLAAAGIDGDLIAEWMPHAQNLLPLAANEDASAGARDHAVTVYRNCINWEPPIHCTMFRDDRYKLNVYHDNRLSGGQGGELYDMEADPLETDNLWNSPAHQETKQKLLFRLFDWTVDQEHTYRQGGEQR
jgi:arylsulfatase A-like enzyme